MVAYNNTFNSLNLAVCKDVLLQKHHKQRATQQRLDEANASRGGDTHQKVSDTATARAWKR